MNYDPQLFQYQIQAIKNRPNADICKYHIWRQRKIQDIHQFNSATSKRTRSWRNSLQLPSVAGLQRVADATSPSWILLWSILLLLGLACTGRDVYTVTVQYLQYPIITSVTLDQVAALPFPAVTVCNLNRVHCANLRQQAAVNWGTELGSQLLKLHDLTDCKLHFQRRKGRQINEGNGVDSDNMVPSTEVPISGSTTPPPANQTRTFNDLMHFMAIYANFSSEIQDKIGHSFNDFIRSCTFSGESCLNSTLFFSKLATNSYGNCYTFHTSRKTVIPGKEYGLSMELYLDQANYLRAGLSAQAGARVVVHEQNEEPLPQEMGINISPSSATSVALLQVQVSRLPYPYQSNCTYNWDQSSYKQYTQGSFTYSSQRCQRVCLQIAFEDSCQCSHPAYMDLQRGYPPCNLTSGTVESLCVSQVVKAFETRTRICDCNMDCREITYEATLSTATWPTDTDWCTAASRLSLLDSCDNIDQEFGGNQHQNERLRIQGNLLKVDVYLQSLRVRSVSQTPAMPPQVLVASLGGALSLYLGLSLLSLLEIGGLLVHIFKSTVWKYVPFLKSMNSRKRQLKNSAPYPIKINQKVSSTQKFKVQPRTFMW